MSLRGLGADGELELAEPPTRPPSTERVGERVGGGGHRHEPVLTNRPRRHDSLQGIADRRVPVHIGPMTDTIETTTLGDRYIALWNEPDPAARRAMIRELWATDGSQ